MTPKKDMLKPLSKGAKKTTGSNATLWIVSAIVIAAAGGLGYWAYTKSKQDKKRQTGKKIPAMNHAAMKSNAVLASRGGSSSAPLSSSSSANRRFSCRNTGFPLAFGTCNEQVKTLQKYLVSKKYALGSNPIDGKFGSKTEMAVKKEFGKTSISEPEFKGIQFVA